MNQEAGEAHGRTGSHLKASNERRAVPVHTLPMSQLKDGECEVAMNDLFKDWIFPVTIHKKRLCG